MFIAEIISDASGHTLLTDGDETILEMLRKENLLIFTAPCGGSGKCGKCRVTVVEEEGNTYSCLACQSKIKCNCRIILSNSTADCQSVINKLTIKDSLPLKSVSTVDDKQCSIAVDIGTTTIAVYLFELSQGNMIASAAVQNPQVCYGADVVARIDYMQQHEEGMQLLQAKLRISIETLIAKALAAAKKQGYDTLPSDIILVGNTVMTQIFWGIDCSSLGSLPFVAQLTEIRRAISSEKVFSGAKITGEVLSLPNVASFVGADALSAAIAVELIHCQGNSLLLDLGTNGEILLNADGIMFAASAAAGPAFEGANISCGMSALGGAIDKVEKCGDGFCYSVLGNVAAQGMCGSGLLTAIAVFTELGIILPCGKINSSLPPEYQNIIHKIGRKKGIIVCENVILWQQDIRALQLAKAAVRTGIEMLLRRADINSDSIDRIFLAGAFGMTVDIHAALSIGLLPAVSIEKIINVGNAAGIGAQKVLLHKQKMLKEVEHIKNLIQHVELTSESNFQTEFINNLTLGC